MKEKCINCPKKFTPKNSEQKYCSHKCQKQWNSRVYSRQSRMHYGVKSIMFKDSVLDSRFD